MKEFKCDLMKTWGNIKYVALKEVQVEPLWKYSTEQYNILLVDINITGHTLSHWGTMILVLHQCQD